MLKLKTTLPLLLLLAFFIASCGSPNEDASQVTQDLTESGDTISPPADEAKGMDNTVGYKTVQMSTDYDKMLPLPPEVIEETQRYPVYLPDHTSLDLSPERYYYRFLLPDTGEKVGAVVNREEQPPLFEEACLSAPHPLDCSNERLRNYLKEKAAPDHEGELVYAYITIDEKGQLERVDQLKLGEGETCANCTKIAETIVQRMPDWVPARLDGIPVKSQAVIPIYIES
jgi:hypothetical protein